ncbi:Rpp14/Pop5 family protein [Methanoculleus chikugoensis]|uniref:Rpp14/Pop5 family protein n=1 Tax=Methanoculleus chikugoensis TaxID=118126 RepID=UPI000A8B1819|nr:Rpp14/Pop5 family protein [Methanoculleus chikugoensis]
MRPRPPAMRTKRRYILARILPPYGVQVDQKQVYLAVIEAATSLLGDAASGLAQPAVVFCEGGIRRRPVPAGEPRRISPSRLQRSPRSPTSGSRSGRSPPRGGRSMHCGAG